VTRLAPQPGERVDRLAPQPGERIDREARVSFTFDGRSVAGFAGDTIGSALFASGRRTFSRSFKYHRPRGLLCCAGHCPNCLVAVDGAPGIRACTEPVRDGMDVRHMNAWPSLEFDAMRVTDVVGGPFTPPGFYYKTFIRPRRLWPLYEKLLRHAAGLGRLPASPDDGRRRRTEYRRRHADVLVVGGGEAGLHAAIAAAQDGADVVLADEGPEPGGRMLFEGRGAEAAALTARARAAGVEVLSMAPVLGWFDGLCPIWQGSTLHQVRAATHVFATGTIEQPPLFAGNDLPGVMLPGAVRRLVALYAVRPGTRAVVVGGVGGGDGGGVSDVLREAGVVVIQADSVFEARGRKHVTEVVATVAGATQTIRCDLLVASAGSTPALSLALQAGAEAAYDAHGETFVLSMLPEGTFAAGDVAGMPAAQSGEEAGRAAATHAVRGGVPSGNVAFKAPASNDAVAQRVAWTGPPIADPPRPHRKGKAFVCLCEDVTTKDVQRTVAEGYDDMELAKRYSTVFMGPCQGKMCQLHASRELAKHTGQAPAEIRLTTARPPWSSVPLGVLAGRPLEPAKRSALHQRHRDLGATVQWAGDWRRAYDYGDPPAEALAVHRSAGLIDVSTLGKLIVRGDDAGRFLDRLYPNRFSDLKPGRVRYGVLTSDAGRILDDGTVCRLDERTYYVTTTSSGAGAVEQWFSWWLSEWDLDVALTDVSQGLAAMNLAGPDSRPILQTLTDLDCGPDAFKYLDGRQADVAGVPCLILRIGFVGELGYELHCPAPQAGALWDAILAEKHPTAQPFGLEPQRMLRLQKMHILVGQDTDSESTPYGAAMPWIVKLDKDDDFIGRWALEHAADHPPATVLVGFRTTNGKTPPTEGAVVVHENEAAGQVTSARFSPKLQQVIGLAWVPSALARDDAELEISDRGQRISATVTTRPFYDPDGAVLRS
jgi:sarcosine oxidase subunit alpha